MTANHPNHPAPSSATGAEIDLSSLALDRGTPHSSAVSPVRLLTRYVLPGAILMGFVALGVWSARDWLMPARQVTVVPVVAMRVERRAEGTALFQAPGWIEPHPTAVRVPALTEGVLEQLLVVQDQAVTAGQPVATLVDDDARLALDQALAELQLREADEEQARAALRGATERFDSPVHLESALAEAEAELAAIETALGNLPFEIRRAEAARDFARRTYESNTAAGEAIAVRELDRARTEVAATTATVEELGSRVQKLEQQHAALTRRRGALERQLDLKIDERREREVAAAALAAAEARVQEARVRGKAARLRLDRMIVRAPVDGRVLHLVAEPGTALTTDKGHSDAHDGITVVTLYRSGRLQVRADVRFEDLLQVVAGQPVQILSPAVAGPVGGTVLHVTSSADIQKNTLEVKIAIEDPPPLLKPEMLVQVTFLAPPGNGTDESPSEERRLYLPSSVVRRDEGGPFVWLADPSRRIVRRAPIETGRTTAEDLVEIPSGLNLTSRVVDAGAERLRDGNRIRITGEP